MMTSKAVVPVFYLDQDHTWQPPCRTVSRIEARRLKMTGAGSFFESGRAFRLHVASPPPDIAFLPGPLETAATITLAEIEANVGIARSPQLVRSAQHKIRAYPHIFDKLAVLAHGSWMQSQVQIAVAG